jgi:acetate kinase
MTSHGEHLTRLLTINSGSSSLKFALFERGGRKRWCCRAGSNESDSVVEFFSPGVSQAETFNM